jgi:predicted nucleic acid-binding protein
MRAKDKTSTFLTKVLQQFVEPSISTVVLYEVELGTTRFHRELWDNLLGELTVIPFRDAMALVACEIKHQLKKQGNQIELADLFIAATAIANGLPLATLNRKHFDQIEGLKLFYPELVPHQV